MGEERSPARVPPWHSKWQGGVAKAKLDVLDALSGYPVPVQKKVLMDMGRKRVIDQAVDEFAEMYEEGELDDFNP